METAIKVLLIIILVGLVIILLPFIILFLGIIFAGIAAGFAWMFAHLGTTILWLIIIGLILYIIFS
jgi:hypothetical protein